MKRALAGVIVCLTVGAPWFGARAQTRENSLRDGMWALQFSFDNGFNGGRVALKRHLTDKDVLRVGFSFFARALDTDGEYLNDAVSTEDEDYAQTDAEILYLRYPRPLAAANVYFGGGPFVEYAERSYTRHVTAVDGDFERRFSEDQNVELGIVAVVGAEWFASRALSLHLEYSLRGSHVWRDSAESYSSTLDPSDRREFSGEGWQVEGGELVMIGIGMYF